MTIERPTEYGKFVRELRRNRKENLSVMANKLNVSISFLSLLESGKKQIPKDFISKLILVYNLNETEKNRLYNSIEVTNNKSIISLNNISTPKRNMVLTIARNIDKISDEQAIKIIDIIK